MSPRGGQPRMVQRGQETRAALLDATTRVVVQHGYAGANLRAIAAEAGVAVGTIFRHYPNKAALFAAALSRQIGPTVTTMSNLADRAGTGTVAGNLIEILTALASLQEKLLPFELAFLTDPELAAQRRQLTGSASELPGPPRQLAGYLAAEQRIGRIRADIDPGQAAIVVLATLFGLIAAPMSVDTQNVIPEASIRATVTMLLEGLNPRKSTQCTQ